MARARHDEDAARNEKKLECGRVPCSAPGRPAGRVTARGPHRGPPPTGARARAPKRRGADNARVIGRASECERAHPEGHSGTRAAPTAKRGISRPAARVTGRDARGPTCPRAPSPQRSRLRSADHAFNERRRDARPLTTRARRPRMAATESPGASRDGHPRTPRHPRRDGSHLPTEVGGENGVRGKLVHEQCLFVPEERRHVS